MRSLSFTIDKLFAVVLATVVLLAMPAAARDLRLAVIAPDGTEASLKYAAELSTSLADHADVLDESLVASAYKSASPQTPFNMTAAEAKNIGAAIGCDFFILVRSADQRRSSYEREEYYESYAAVYAVSARTGRLVDWSLPKFESSKSAESARLLARSIPAKAAELAVKLKTVFQTELDEPVPPAIEELPADGMPNAKEFRTPIPYLRIKPEYTPLAFLYESAATVELELDLDAAGNILRTEIVRWAGYGLDESVETAVRKMNWRPAERKGKPLPMRVLLRYNFKKLDK
jgi:hypothetical protein